ncbi:membrane-associated protein, putative [Bodo saltans]|uniref:Membrane-associated protein, putative n=1 Tax=Bodo saltans TaxID=75058 RepID=A0A0S4J7C6_BODSA|nr:membrane-associated protein, putative [Bodo saltans]|eukprot:CUG85753.1 membrane-associated protein, putative [Bodo saltans]
MSRNSNGEWNMRGALLMIVLVLVSILCSANATTEVVLTEANVNVNLASNTRYLLRSASSSSNGCSSSLTSGVLRNVTMLWSTPSAVLENVEIVVEGGCTVPLVTLGNSSAPSLDNATVVNISIILRNVSINPYYNGSNIAPTAAGPLLLPSLVTISPSVSVTNNISLRVEDSNLSIEYNLITSTNVSFYLAASLLLGINSGSVERRNSSTTIKSVNVQIIRSCVSYRLGGNINYAAAGLVTMIAGATSGPNIIDGVNIEVINSSLAIVVNTTFVLGDYINVNPAMFGVQCTSSAVVTSVASPCQIRNVNFIAGGSETNGTAATTKVPAPLSEMNSTITTTTTTLSLMQYAPGVVLTSTNTYGGADETATMFSISTFSTLEGVRVSSLPGTSVIIVSECDGPAGIACNISATKDGIITSKISLRAEAFYIRGPKSNLPTIQSVHIAVMGSSFNLAGKKSALVISCSYFRSVRDVSFLARRNIATLSAAGQLIVGMVTRSVGFVDLSNADNASVVLEVTDTLVNVSSASSGCIIASGFVVSLMGNISNTSVVLTNVTMMHRSVSSRFNDTAFLIQSGFEFSFHTSLSTLVNVAPQDPTTMILASNISVSVVNSSLDAMHSANLPAITFATSIIILSAITALNLQQSMVHSSVYLHNVHAIRELPPSQSASDAPVAGPASWFPPTFSGMRANMTSLVNYYDLMSTIQTTLEKIPLVGLVAPALFVASGYGASSVSLTNVSTTVDNNCTVAYAAEQLPSSSPSATDLLSIIVLPTRSIQSWYVVTQGASSASEGVEQQSLTSQQATVAVTPNNGSCIGTLGAATIEDSVLIFQDIHLGLARLIIANFGNLSLNGSHTRLEFVSCSFSTIAEGGNEFAMVANSGASIAVNISTIMQNASLFTVRWCVFGEGFSHLILPSTINPFIPPETTTSASFVSDAIVVSSSSSSALSSTVVADNRRRFFLQLGCNVWNGVGMRASAIYSTARSSTNVNSSTLLLYTDYDRSTYGQIVCSGLAGTQSRTITTFIPASPPPQLAVPSTAVNAVTSVVGVLGAVAASLVDAQVLIALGFSTCAPQSLKDSTSASRFLLSPFYTLGNLAMVLGNFGIFACLHVVHRVLVRWKRLSSQRRVSRGLFPRVVNSSVSSSAARPLTSSSHDSNNLLLVPINQNVSPQLPTFTTSPNTETETSSTASSSLRAEVALKFPNHSITVAMLLATGVVIGGVRGLFSGEMEDTVAGVIALLVVAAGAWWRIRAGASKKARRLKFFRYSHAQRYSFAAPWALPLGTWGPLALRATHGRLRTAIRPGAEWLSAETLVIGLVVQAVASIPVPTSWCVGLWFVGAAIQISGAALVIYVRPARAPLSDVLQATSLVTAASIQMISGLLAASVAVEGSDTALSALALCSMGVSAIKSGHAGIMFLWERKQQSARGGLQSDPLIDGESTLDFAMPALLILEQTLFGKKTRMTNSNNNAARDLQSVRHRVAHVGESKMLELLIFFTVKTVRDDLKSLGVFPHFFYYFLSFYLFIIIIVY